jgi:hypothetical protein
MWKPLRNGKGREAEGQSLVEMAIALPVLLLVLLGLIDLALMLRAQLVLVNANREAARFGGQGFYTDEQIAQRAITAFAGQLPVQVTGEGANTDILITRFHAPSRAADDGYYITPIYYTGTLGHVSRFDPDQMLSDLKTKNDQFNQDLIDDPDLGEGAVRVAHDAILVEIWFHHDLVFYAPLVERVFPRLVQLHSWTLMRIGRSDLGG